MLDIHLVLTDNGGLCVCSDRRFLYILEITLLVAHPLQIISLGYFGQINPRTELGRRKRVFITSTDKKMYVVAQNPRVAAQSSSVSHEIKLDQ